MIQKHQELKTPLKDVLKEKHRVHFLGIGGVGMSALARVLRSRGFSVSGYDLKMSKAIERLIQEGCEIDIGLSKPLPETDVVVYSSAISQQDPQYRSACEKGLLLYHRSEMLGYLMDSPISVGVTGTHGKTTTSALVSFIVHELGFDPTCFVGGTMLNYHTNALIGNGSFMVAEVDESDKSLLNIHPQIAIITNLEEEHLDIYSGIEDIRQTIVRYIKGLNDPGVVVYNADDAHLQEIIPCHAKKYVSFGITHEARFQARTIVHDGAHTRFDLYVDGAFIQTVHLTIPGKHNVYNCLAALAALAQLDISVQRIVEVLPRFKNTARRIEVKYEDNDVVVVDDYAHHPTEIMATLSVLRHSLHDDQTLVAVFQPHRFSRTMHLCEQFGTSFNHADHVMVTDIYSAGETRIIGVDERMIYHAVKEKGTPTIECVPRKDIIDTLVQRGFNGYKKALIAFLGAGNITEIADEFSATLKSQSVRK